MRRSEYLGDAGAHLARAEDGQGVCGAWGCVQGAGEEGDRGEAGEAKVGDGGGHGGISRGLGEGGYTRNEDEKKGGSRMVRERQRQRQQGKERKKERGAI